MVILYKLGWETVSNGAIQRHKICESGSRKRTVKDAFLDSEERSQQQPEIGKREGKPKAVGSRAREICQEPLSQTRGVAGLNKPCYCASVWIIYESPFYHPPHPFLCTFPVLFKISSIKNIITVISVSALILRCLRAIFNSFIKGVSQQSLKAKKRDQKWESKATVTNNAYLIRQHPIIL